MGARIGAAATREFNMILISVPFYINYDERVPTPIGVRIVEPQTLPPTADFAYSNHERREKSWS